MNRPRLALASASGAVDLDEDLAPLLSELAAAGADASVAVWDDPAVDWAGFDLVVVRSVWDYAPRREEFLAWADRVASLTELANPAPMLRWNTDKRYLGELSAAGVPVTPTTFLAPGDPVRLPPGEIVVKPCVSAGSLDTERYPPHHRAAAAAHVERLLDAGRDVMVQPYLSSVDTAGETGMVFVAGEFSHAFRKGPMLRPDVELVDGGLYRAEEITPRAAGDDELALAHAALAAVPASLGAWLYARVDVVRDDRGAPVVLELELAEPSLFVLMAPDAPRRVAQAFASRAAGAAAGRRR